MLHRLSLFLFAALGAACTQQTNDVEYAELTAPSPQLVAIAPDVEVVVGAREPVFRANNAYWLYRDGRWYRSTAPTGAQWQRIATPPPAIAQIDRPEDYVDYDREQQARADEDRVPTPSDVERMRHQPPHDPTQPAPEPPYANPQPPQQEPPVMPDSPTRPDRVPREPTAPPQADDLGEQPTARLDEPLQPERRPEPVDTDDYEQNRPDRMRDR